MHPTTFPAQSAPDPGSFLVGISAVALLFLVAVAYVEHRSNRQLFDAGEIGPEAVRGRAWSMVLGGAVLLVVLAVGMAVTFWVIVNFPLTDLAVQVAWLFGALLSLGIGLGLVWWLGRPIEPAGTTRETQERDTYEEPETGTASSPDAE